MFFLLIYPVSFVKGQSNLPEPGLPYIQNFTTKEYGGHAQNWAIVQDQRGIIYVANTLGVLEYDGVSWRLIETYPELRGVFSLAADENNRIYVGSYNELGYLSPDSVGQMRYVSLMEHLPTSYHQCYYVWYTNILKRGVYFTTPKYIFCWRNGSFKTWEAATAFKKSFIHNQQFYVEQDGFGLMKLTSDSLEMVPDGEKLKDSTIRAFLPYKSGQMIIATMKKGMYVWNGESIIPFKNPTHDITAGSRCSGGLVLPDSSIAICSYKKGVFIFNKQYELQTIFDKTSGLFNDFVMNMHVDAQNGLWLATQNGISRIEYPSPLSFYNKELGLEGGVFKIHRHQGVLHAATSLGVYYLSDRHSDNKKSYSRLSFKKNQDIEIFCWDLLSFGQRLLVAGRHEIFEINNNRVNKIKPPLSTLCFVRSKQDSNRVFLGLSNGLASIYFSKQKWIYEGKFEKVKQRIRQMAEDENGALWLSTADDGVRRIDFLLNTQTIKSNIWENATITQFDTSHGLPSMMDDRVFRISGQNYWGTRDGIYRFDSMKQRFLPNRKFGLPSPKDSWAIGLLAMADNSDLWMVLGTNEGYELGVAAQQSDSTYQWYNLPFQRYNEIQVYSIFPEENGVLWFGSPDELGRYDARIHKEYLSDYTALIRRITVNGESILYGGAGNISDSLSYYVKTPLTLTSEENALRFEYATPSFDVSAANRFQYFLDGFDDDWSDWTSETMKDYTNLPQGIYHFKVKAQNVYKHISADDVFSFRILPPWYQTVWAYIFYALLVAAIIYLIVKWRSRQLEMEKIALEKLVAERTEEVRLQAEKLKEMDNMKSRFFANISHEFRTPLTLIIDPLNEMIAGTFKGDIKKYFNVMKRNAVRLLRLINQLLDLSKLESGGLLLQTRLENIIPFLKGVVNSFASKAAGRAINLKFITKYDEIQLYFDQDKLEKIITNLIANAFKFTSDNGQISIIIDTSEDAGLSIIRENQKAKNNQFVRITIKDSGVGIPAERLPYIFDRFYHTDTMHKSEQEGIGIGLALTKELVNLHHGEIFVNSYESEGTEFIVLLPLGRDHLQDSEIITDGFPAETIVPGATTKKFFAEDEFAEMVEQHTEVLKNKEKPDSQYRILVVEDNVDVRNYIREHLEPNYDVSEAPNGSAGVELALQDIHDLIISDVMMPEMDGYELCQVLKNDIRTSHIPIILLTAKAEDSDKITGLKTGADDYIIKPFNSQELLTRIKNLIELRRKLQEKYKMEFLLQPGEVAVESLDDEFLKKACKIVEDNLSDPEFSTGSFSKKIAMSRVNLYRKLQAVVNQSPSEFIRSIRLKRAAQLFQQHAGNITEITFQVGFTSTAYFTKCFREQFGCPPSEYINKHN